MNQDKLTDSNKYLRFYYYFIKLWLLNMFQQNKKKLHLKKAIGLVGQSFVNVILIIFMFYKALAIGSLFTDP